MLIILSIHESLNKMQIGLQWAENYQMRSCRLLKYSFPHRLALTSSLSVVKCSSAFPSRCGVQNVSIVAQWFGYTSLVRTSENTNIDAARNSDSFFLSR